MISLKMHSSASDRIRRAPAILVMGAIRVYQLTLSAFIGGQCRFYPTCSHYTMEAVQIHGALKGSWLGVKRIGRCHPHHPGGVDEVPQAGPALSKEI